MAFAAFVADAQPVRFKTPAQNNSAAAKKTNGFVK
jgi:hypothetical protein